MTKLFIFWLITMTAVVVGWSYRGSLLILGGVFFYAVVFHIFWLITVESSSRSSKRKGALVGIGGATVVGNRAGPLIALLRQMRVTRYMRYIYAICVKKICYS